MRCANLEGFASHIRVLTREVHTVVRLGGRTLIRRANLKGFASHIRVLTREVPYILYIKKKPGLFGPG